MASEHGESVLVREPQWHPLAQPESVKEVVHLVVRLAVQWHEVFVPFRAEAGVLEVVQVVAEQVPVPAAHGAHERHAGAGGLLSRPRHATLTPRT
ncbi:hypothetical protein [Agromyces mariniharenae]|uniref:Uncharacterized protein n=1 Tax=Agromyces mariniharenae TaxID=2604423 RepID=A0A5S4UW80_9MICO|nr:hypothetical protein [Agromyces mariniharenae]TYL50428.1 hypothetical protein FYC51_14570 [Agromyces mariniharenae]